MKLKDKLLLLCNIVCLIGILLFLVKILNSEPKASDYDFSRFKGKTIDGIEFAPATVFERATITIKTNDGDSVVVNVYKDFITVSN